MREQQRRRNWFVVHRKLESKMRCFAGDEGESFGMCQEKCLVQEMGKEQLLKLVGNAAQEQIETSQA